MGKLLKPLESLDTSDLATFTMQTSPQTPPHIAHLSHSETEDEGDGGSSATGREMGCSMLAPAASYTKSSSVRLQLRGEKKASQCILHSSQHFGI